MVDHTPKRRVPTNSLARKYIGYEEFARYVSSDDDFFALRRFDRTHCRLLLMLHDQVAELEGELDSIDARLSQRDADDVDNGSVRRDVQERKDILEKLLRKVGEYGQPRALITPKS